MKPFDTQILCHSVINSRKSTKKNTHKTHAFFVAFECVISINTSIFLHKKSQILSLRLQLRIPKLSRFDPDLSPVQICPLEKNFGACGAIQTKNSFLYAPVTRLKCVILTARRGHAGPKIAANPSHIWPINVTKSVKSTGSCIL